MALLFDKSWQELKKAFVVNRLCEGSRFKGYGLMIDEWIKGQSVADAPEDEVWRMLINRCDTAYRDGPTEFNACMNRAWGGMTDEVFLKRYGIPRTSISFNSLNVAAQLLDRLDAAATIYATTDGWIVTMCPALMMPISVQCDHIHAAQVRYATRTDVICVALHAWKAGAAGKREEARRFLCAWLTDVVARMRQNAERDFDVAVCVSADGKRIEHADKVLVYARDGSALGTLFDSAYFAGTNKVRRPACFAGKHAAHFRSGDADEFNGPIALETFWWHSKAHQKPFRTRWMNEVAARIRARVPYYIRFDAYSVLFVNEQHCQHPLPAGGMLIE